MGEKQKNQAMVNAFGTGKPPVATVRRLGESKQQQKARGQGVDPNSDINAIFSGMQQMRTKVHKGMSGMPLNPDGTDPGNSFDEFMRKNPHLRGAAQRQTQYDQQRKDNFLPNVQSSIDAVKQQKGYTDAQGNFVPPTMPSSPSSPYGTGSVKFLPAGSKSRGTMPHPITGKPVYMDEYLPALEKIQESKYGPGVRSYGQGIERLPSKNKSFLPGQISPPGGASDARVGASQVPGEPGGETLFGQMPDVQGKGMPENYNRTLGYGPNAGPQADWNAVLGYNKPNQGPQPNWNASMGYGPNSGPQQYAMGPNEGPQRPADFGPQLPYSSGEQLMALKRLSGFGGNTNPTLTALEGTWSNIFPGVKDYDYLHQLFPGLVHPQAGSGQVMTSLAKMYQNPAYQALFPNVNQSEFYR